MWKLHNSITSVAFLNEKLLNRWLTSIVILIQKDNGRTQIYQLPIKNTYEYKYDLILKYFWPKQGMKKSETNKWLGSNQIGGRKMLVQLKRQPSTNSLWKRTDWLSFHYISIRMI